MSNHSPAADSSFVITVTDTNSVVGSTTYLPTIDIETGFSTVPPSDAAIQSILNALVDAIKADLTAPFVVSVIQNWTTPSSVAWDLNA